MNTPTHPHRLRLTLGLLMAAIVALTLFTPTATATTDQCNTKVQPDDPSYPKWATLCKDKVTASATPSASTKPVQSSQSASPGGGAVSSSSVPSTAAGVQPTSSSTPSTAAEEWASEAAKEVPPLLKTVEDRYRTTPNMRTGFVTAYSFMFGIGIIIFCFMLVMQVGRASRESPEARAEFMQSLPKFVLYVPVMSLVPAFVYWIYGQIASPMITAMGEQSWPAATGFISQFTDAVMKDPLALVGMVGGPIIAILVFLGMIVVLVLWLIEHMVAEFGVYLLTVLIPVAAALSLNPRWYKMLGRVGGVIIGCMLVPVITRFGLWVMWLAMGDKMADSSENLLVRLLWLGVVFGLATSAPMLLSYISPHVLPQGGTTSAGGGGSARGAAHGAMSSGQDAISRLTNTLKSSKSSPDEVASEAGPSAVGGDMPATAPAAGSAPGATSAGSAASTSTTATSSGATAATGSGAAAGAGSGASAGAAAGGAGAGAAGGAGAAAGSGAASAAAGSGAASAAAGSGAAAGAGAAAAAGSVAGPVGAAIGAAVAVGAQVVSDTNRAVESTSRSAAAMQLGASGGGHTSHAETSMPPTPDLPSSAAGPGSYFDGYRSEDNYRSEDLTSRGGEDASLGQPHYDMTAPADSVGSPPPDPAQPQPDSADSPRPVVEPVPPDSPPPPAAASEVRDPS